MTTRRSVLGMTGLSARSLAVPAQDIEHHWSSTVTRGDSQVTVIENAWMPMADDVSLAAGTLRAQARGI
jgi:hypothetical protein